MTCSESLSCGPAPKTGEHDLSTRFAAFQQPMRLQQVLCGNRCKTFANGRAKPTVIDKICNRIEQLVLSDHVGRLEHRPGEHQFPMQGHGFLFQQAHVDQAGIVDKSDAPLRCHDLRDGGEMLVGLGQAGNARHGRCSKGRDLCRKIARVVEDVVCAKVTAPVRAFRP